MTFEKRISTKGACMLIGILLACISEAIGQDVRILEPSGGTIFSIGDTVDFTLLADTSQPLQVLSARFHPSSRGYLIAHILHFSSVDMIDSSGRVWLDESRDTLDGYKVMNVQWIIPDSVLLAGASDYVSTAGDSCTIAYSHFQFQEDEVFYLEPAIQISNDLSESENTRPFLVRLRNNHGEGRYVDLLGRTVATEGGRDHQMPHTVVIRRTDGCVRIGITGLISARP